MSHIHKKIRSLQQGPVLLLLTILASSPSAWADSQWADEPAALTINEFLNLHFRLSMERPDSDSLNSFSLVSFFPSSDPQSAFVFVIQAWRDEQLEAPDLRREIRVVGGAITAHFEAMARHPFVSKRWKVANPKANIIVKHVRHSDFRETLAVTMNGETAFGDDAIAKARTAVTSRGAAW